MQALDTLADDLAALRADRLTATAFCARARALPAQLSPLPARYGEVLQALLDRLESGALFTEESCSFSQQGLLDQFDQWLARAREAALTARTNENR